ncbi:MAG: hypothetical protein JJE04_23340 [Acidobacteriia bacterium]|nr:hypothetical protein [Terriglobia bacterium]
MTGSFCGACGASAGAAAAPEPAPELTSTGAGTGTGATGSGSQPLTNNAAAALCYLLGIITGVIFLAWAPYNQDKNIRFHAFQAIFLTIAWVVFQFLLAAVIPWSMMYAMSRIMQLAGMLLWLFLMWKTYNNERVVLPVIGDLAAKQA